MEKVEAVTTLDKIRLNNIILYGYHGTSPAESQMRQKVEVDVELAASLERPGKDDDLEETIDYTKVYSLVEEVVTEKKFKLLEALARELVMRLLSSFPVDEALVRVRKLNVPFAGNASSVEVEVCRSRK